MCLIVFHQMKKVKKMRFVSIKYILNEFNSAIMLRYAYFLVM